MTERVGIKRITGIILSRMDWRRRQGSTRAGRLALALAIAVAAVGCGVLALRRFGLEPVVVEGHSMEPALPAGGLIAVGRRPRALSRGAVVLVRRPGGSGLEVVKRVIGLPGEQVRLQPEGLVVDGRALAEPWLRGRRAVAPADAGRREIALGAGEYLVLGDRRGASTDGRHFGPVRFEDVLGRVRFVYWPPAAWTANRSLHVNSA